MNRIIQVRVLQMTIDKLKAKYDIPESVIKDVISESTKEAMVIGMMKR